MKRTIAATIAALALTPALAEARPFLSYNRAQGVANNVARDLYLHTSATDWSTDNCQRRNRSQFDCNYSLYQLGGWSDGSDERCDSTMRVTLTRYGNTYYTFPGTPDCYAVNSTPPSIDSTTP